MSHSPRKPILLVVADKAAMRRAILTPLVPAVTDRAHQAASLTEAITMLRDQDLSIDLVIADMAMADAAAVTLTRKMREAGFSRRYDKLPIILITNRIDTPLFQAAARLGIQGHVLAPFEASILRAAVGRALGTARPQEAAPHAVPSTAAHEAPEASASVLTFPSAVELEPVIQVAEMPEPAAPPSLDGGFGFDVSKHPGPTRARRRKAAPRARTLIAVA